MDIDIDREESAWDHLSVMDPMPSPDELAWRERAACLPYPAVLFFGLDDNEPQADRRMREEKAKAICEVCEVRRECLEYALATREPYGIWGGLNEVERKQLLRGRPN